MQINQLRLIHFRGITDLTLDFPERTTVLVGVNGAGKSSILDALRFLLMRFVEEIYNEMAGKDDPGSHRQLRLVMAALKLVHRLGAHATGNRA